MARRRQSTVKTFKAEAGADYGPAMRLRPDGRYAAWGGAAAVVMETRDDPDVVDHRRLVRGARRRDPLTDLEACRVITKRMRDAAEQFLSDCSRASGGAAGTDVGMPSLVGPSAGVPELQMLAIERINIVREKLNIERGTIFWWVLFENGSIRDFEVTRRLRNGSAAQMLRDVLDALDEHYHRTTARKGA